MKTEDFVKALDTDFFAGVPDSLLGPLCDYLYESYGVSEKHIVAANEGNAVALAAGHYIATGRKGTVYMQNSGIGNALNPIASLLNEKIYGIPVIFVVGWRGEPGVHDEPQHVFQGEITVPLLELLGLDVMIVDGNTTADNVKEFLKSKEGAFAEGKSVALVVKKGALTYDGKPAYFSAGTMSRERAIELIADKMDGSVFVSTTGKASRELFEIREKHGKSHKTDFLTVGSMGHASSIALQLATELPERRVVLIDGDGAVVMHMGSLLVAAETAPKNLIHFVINNGVHDSVGGMPTPAKQKSLSDIAAACGYGRVFKAENEDELSKLLDKLSAEDSEALTFVEVITTRGARKDLGRPTLTAKENIDNFTAFLRE
ncbi:MAG: phosphonopyruvate decarboxylase [Clostridia bacterium]|nr:phosphonopyruvate decarboxylase [Clostridia bacterium]